MVFFQEVQDASSPKRNGSKCVDYRNSQLCFYCLHVHTCTIVEHWKKIWGRGKSNENVKAILTKVLNFLIEYFLKTVCFLYNTYKLIFGLFDHSTWPLHLMQYELYIFKKNIIRCKTCFYACNLNKLLYQAYM